MQSLTVYFKKVSKSGAVSYDCAQVWDKEKFLLARKEEAVELSKKDPSLAYFWGQVTEEEYLASKARSKG